MSSLAPQWIQLPLVILFGLCVGSFLNVVIVRWPRRRSLISPSSRCGFCRSSIPWWMNIPLLGYLVTAGACIKCGHVYSARYPLVELMTGILFAAVYSIYGWTLDTAVFSPFSASLVAMSFIDLEFRLIPDEISLGGWALALGLTLLPLESYHIEFMEAALASVLSFGFFWFFSRAYYWIRHEEGLGGGDVKLMGFVGALLGFKGAITTVIIGSSLGGLVGLFWILVMRRSRHFPIPFGPFLAVGALVSVLGLDAWLWGGIFDVQ